MNSMITKRIGDTIVFINADLNKLHDNTKVKIISQRTQNTWQPDRESEEKQRDTAQGKIAEYFVEYYLNNVLKLCYIPYDDFRKNDFTKHAPFDGILIKKYDEDFVEGFIELITKEVSENERGQISVNLHEKLIENDIYTVEIKSTKVVKRHKKGNNINEIIEAIKNDDYLEYPHYCRSSYYINRVEDYVEYLNSLNKFSKRVNLENLKEVELPFMKFFYIRVYMDYNDKIVYLIGFITREKFFVDKPKIKKMVKWGKSEKAIYFAKNIKEVTMPVENIKDYLEEKV